MQFFAKFLAESKYFSSPAKLPIEMSSRWNLMRTWLHSRCPSLAILKTYPYMRYRSVMCHFVVKHVSVCRVQSNIFLCHLKNVLQNIVFQSAKGKESWDASNLCQRKQYQFRTLSSITFVMWKRFILKTRWFTVYKW